MRFTSTLCALALLTPVTGFSQMAAPEDSRVLSPVLGKRFATGNVVSATPRLLRRAADELDPLAASHLDLEHLANLRAVGLAPMGLVRLEAHPVLDRYTA